MATVSTYALNCAPAELGGNYPRVLEYFLDVAETGTITQNDIYQMLQGVGDIAVLAGGYEIITPFSASTTIEVGIAGGTEISTAITATAAAGTKGAFTFTANCVLFADDDTVDAQVTGASPTVGKIRFWFLVADVSRNHGATE